MILSPQERQRVINEPINAAGRQVEQSPGEVAPNTGTAGSIPAPAAPTPRTDALAKQLDPHTGLWIEAEEYEQLERELADERLTVRAIQRERDEARHDALNIRDEYRIRAERAEAALAQARIALAKSRPSAEAVRVANKIFSGSSITTLQEEIILASEILRMHEEKP